MGALPVFAHVCDMKLTGWIFLISISLMSCSDEAEFRSPNLGQVMLSTDFNLKIDKEIIYQFLDFRTGTGISLVLGVENPI